MTPEDREFLHQTSVRVGSVNRVLALYVTLLAGFWGGHKFLLGARREGWIYFALAITTIPVWASLADLMDLMRQPAMGQGFLKRRLPKRHPAEASIVERKTRWRLGKVALIMALVIAAIAWMVSRLNDGHARVAGLCAQIQRGMAGEEVVRFAAAHGLKTRPLREGFNILADEATWGRHACHLTVSGGRVDSSTHYFLD